VNIFKIFFIGILFLFSGLYSVEGFAEKLSFPVEKNNVQIFPQRFEYSLVDENIIRIGDIEINANQVSFEIIPQNKDLTQFRFRFQFPVDLISEGEITIKDSIGKALWIQKFQKNYVQTQNKSGQIQVDTQTPGKHRSLVGFFDSIPFDREFLNKLENTSFFRFCVSKIDKETKINLCSKENFLKYKKNKPEIQTREPHRKDSYVVINGRPVDPVGIVFLNQVSDPISLQALLLSGASVEIDTRRKEVRFTDILKAESPDQVLIRAKGTEPVDESAVKRISADEWETLIPLRRPILYLKGEGGIPMRQEFLITGPLRDESLQIEIIDGIVRKTYSEEIKIKFKKPDTVNLLAGDKRSQIESSTQTWTLKDLKKGEINKRSLQVIENDNKFTTEYEVYRGFPITAFTRGMYPLFSQTQFQWWHGGFRWGAALNVDKSLSKSKNENDWTQFGAEFLFRFNESLNGDDSIIGIIAFTQQSTYDIKLSSSGFGFFAEQKVDDPYIDWINAKINFPLFGGGEGYQQKTSWNIEASARHFANRSTFYELGVRGFSYKFEKTSSISFNRNMLFVGVGTLF
jgi:hypothetical protein